VLLCEVDSSQGGCWGCIVAPKVNDAARNAKSRGELGVATMGKPNDFASDTVLLRGERERSERGRQKSRVRRGCKVQANGSLEQLDIGEAKGGRLAFSARVFARPE
jgi:hypothetical protein